ncbi:MAG TPA: Fe-S-containing hydro-lyase [Campylobacterales bacterium]|nr:Fe-S-containing hydro-lyase [Campylobacterales bacterium]
MQTEDLELYSEHVLDIVYLTGKIYTARDAAHKRLVYLIKNSEKLPFDLNGAVIYFVGPTPPKPGEPIGSAGPTTSYRMDSYSPILIEYGLKGMIGKGKRSKEVKEACKKYKAIYFGATGGAGALLSQRIKNSKIIAYEELGPEAIRELEVDMFPVVVVNDMYGNDLYEKGRREWQKD